MSKIQAGVLSEYVERNYTPTSTIQIDNLEIAVKKSLSFSEMVNFVDGAVKSCFLEDTNIFMPELRSFAIRFGIIEYYTNIELPDNIQEQYHFLMHSDIPDIVIEAVDKVQFKDIVRSIDQKIEHIARANISIIEKQMNDLQHMIMEMLKKFGDLFGGIDIDTINAIKDAYIDGEIHPEKLLASYMNSKTGSEQ